ncbi:MAG: hypothetical protein MOP51_2795 [Citricoccus sp.]|nr:hypothetical protein [Citricoccus sp. WCRC_4]
MNQPDSAPAVGRIAETSVGPAARMGLSEGQLVQELGFDEDIDFDFRDALEDELGTEMLTEEDQDPVDAVVLWWRASDGDVEDLADALMDAQTSLDAGGMLWLMTPRNGREGHVQPADVAEAAPTAGLHVTTTAGVSADWTASRLVGKRNR